MISNDKILELREANVSKLQAELRELDGVELE